MRRCIPPRSAGGCSPTASAPLADSEDGGDEALEALLDVALHRSPRIEAPPQQRALPLRGQQQADALRRVRHPGEAFVQRRRQHGLPGGAARPQRGIAKILAQHQQPLGIGFDAAIVPGSADQQLDRAAGGLRNRAASAAVFSSSRSQAWSKVLLLEPALLSKRCTSVAADSPQASAQRREGQRLRARARASACSAASARRCRSRVFGRGILTSDL